MENDLLIENLADEPARSAFEREYSEDEMRSYIESFAIDDMLERATETDIALYVMFVEELCKKGDRDALMAKGYSCYGGNRAYACDWETARDIFLRLFDESPDPFIANTLGYIYYYGRCNGGAGEYDKAFYWFGIGAAGGVYESRYKLSDMFLHGYGVAKNERIAMDIISELYAQNRKTLIKYGAPSKFADVALRMGNMIKRGAYQFDGKPNPDAAFRYYLQAQYAIKQRLLSVNYYGDRSVAESIRKEIEEVLPNTSYKTPLRRVRIESLFDFLERSAPEHGLYSVKIKRLKGGEYSVTISSVKRFGQKAPPPMLLTVPEAHYCSLVNTISVKTLNLSSLYVKGLPFVEDSAEFLADGWVENAFVLNDRVVAQIESSFVWSASLGDQRRFRFVCVTFPGNPCRKEYLCDDEDILKGDSIIVNGLPLKGLVTDVFERSAAETVLPLAHYVASIKKA